jgi:hypothetical protein
MDEELEKSFKDIINNLISISKDKDLEIMDLKEKLKKERYMKRFNNKKIKKIEYENMILINKIKSMKNENNNVDDVKCYVLFS